MADYTNDQLFEIEEGKKASIDTSIYENPAFLAIQMRQIRMALVAGIKVEPYVKPEYDWMQMEEIFTGLEENVDVSLYADPELPYEKMHQIRKGLVNGIDISADTKYSAGVLKQLRKSKEEKIDIMKYVEQGYDPEQLYQIRLAMIHNIDLEGYIETDFRGAAIAEIRLGLEEDIDVTVYADIRFGWRQMREIRFGLEKRLDISKYANPYYDWEQMREIRLGLAEGLDVSKYSTLMYTSSEMKKRRIILMEGGEEVTLSSDDFEIHTTSGGIEAFISMKRQGERIERDSLIDSLAELDVTYGLIEENIKKICDGNYDNKPIPIARGSIPKKGTDGWYEFFFNTEIDRKPRILEDGSVDYQNMEKNPLVKEGDVLAIYHDAEAGEDGYAVNGTAISGKKGIEKELLKGKGFNLSQDKHTYTAAMDGVVELSGNILNVIKHMEVGDVTLATGNIDFDGSVHVKGNIENGAVVKAAGDIVVDGNVGGAEIISEGKVTLNRGMNAGRRGKVKAKGGVVSKFFESVIVLSDGDIEVITSVNSLMRAKGWIRSSRSIIGGKAFASRGYRVFNLGNEAGTATQVQIGIDEDIVNRIGDINNKMKENTKQLMLLDNSMKELQLKYPPEIRNTMPLFKKIDNAIFSINKQQEDLTKEKEQLNLQVLFSREATMTIDGTAFMGVTCILGKGRWEASGEKRVTLKGTGGATINVVNG
ncbi:MAG: FapA family protein [Lachnospiraceae bacterium]|nr:FapA family protein [Lachnospiraceae bacterium]